MGNKVKNRINSTQARIAAILVLAMSTLGAGLGSLAVLNSTFTATDNFSVATISLQGSTDGTTFAATTSHDFAPLFNGSPYADAYALTVKNSGSTQLRYSISGPSVGGSSWSVVAYKVIPVASAAACTGSTSATGNISSDQVSGPVTVGSSTAGQQAGDRLLNANASEVLCLQATSPTPTAVTGSFTKTLTFSAESTYLNP